MSAVGAIAQSEIGVPIRSELKLQGLSQVEAASLVAKLKDAQKRLKEGEKLTFRLLSGAPAFYPETMISPRQLFLDLPFEDAWLIIREQSNNRLWQPYRLAFKPNKRRLVPCFAEVVLGFGDSIERIELMCEPPPPY